MQPLAGISFARVVTIVLSILGATSGIELGHTDNNVENIAARKQASVKNVGSQENDQKFWKDIGNSHLHQKLSLKPTYGVAKNVIFFLGDGMSISTLTAARVYKGQMENKSASENQMLSFENFPYTGLSKTYCVDSQVADSACSSTAYLTGIKGNIETIGVTGAVSNRDCLASNTEANQAESSMKWAQNAGKRTGVVTNMRVTHATPAGTYANVAQRVWESDTDIINDELADPKCVKGSSDIARQLIEKDTGRNLNLIMGGGRARFLPKTMGDRSDNRNLINEWLNIDRAGANSSYVSNRNELKSLNTNKTDYLLGLFAESHMSYNLLADKNLEPTIVEMTETAIKVLSKGENGYYLFVEGGLIDWAHHSNQAHLSLDETVMFSNAVQRALDMTSREDTLIVVTSDHSHTMTISGYPNRGSDILGHSVISESDKLPYSTLSYANGPSAKQSETDGKRYDLTSDNPHDPNYEFPSMVKLQLETHGGDDVAVFALGPWAHLFVGNYEQNYIPYAISYATNMGPGAEIRKENAETSSSGFRHSVSFGVSILIISYTLISFLVI